MNSFQTPGSTISPQALHRGFQVRNLELEAVPAARAGVAKSTIYRHWDGKLPLIRDTLEVLNEQPTPGPGEGDPREQVERLLLHLVEVLTDSIFSACVPALIEAAEQDSAAREFLHGYSVRRRRTLTQVIRRGVEAGDFHRSVDPEKASISLAGSLFYRRLLTSEPLKPDRIPDLVETVLGPPRTGEWCRPGREVPK